MYSFSKRRQGRMSSKLKKWYHENAVFNAVFPQGQKRFGFFPRFPSWTPPDLAYQAWAIARSAKGQTILSPVVEASHLAAKVRVQSCLRSGISKLRAYRVVRENKPKSSNRWSVQDFCWCLMPPGVMRLLCLGHTASQEGAFLLCEVWLQLRACLLSSYQYPWTM